MRKSTQYRGPGSFAPRSVPVIADWTGLLPQVSTGLWSLVVMEHRPSRPQNLKRNNKLDSDQPSPGRRLHSRSRSKQKMSAMGVESRTGAVTVVSRWIFDLAFASPPQSGLAWSCFLLPSRPGVLHPEPLTDSGRKPLDLSGSCHLLKAAAFRRDQRVPPVAR